MAWTKRGALSRSLARRRGSASERERRFVGRACEGGGGRNALPPFESEVGIPDSGPRQAGEEGAFRSEEEDGSRGWTARERETRRGALAAPGTHYHFMGLDPDADGSTIRNRYRQLSKLYHPDVARSTDEGNDEMFVKLQEAYRILSSPQKRSIYDWRVYLDALQGGSGRLGRWEAVARAASANPSNPSQKRPPGVHETNKMDEEEMVTIEGQGYIALAFDLFAVVVSFLAIVLVSLKDPAQSL